MFGTKILSGELKPMRQTRTKATSLVALSEQTKSTESDDIPQPVIVPFLKWPGGKRWLIASHAAIFPKNYNRFIEPFLGAGSVFFYLQPQRAILGDLNPDVITAFRGVQKEPSGVQRLLEAHHFEHARDYYYMVRDSAIPTSLAERAARVIYLNRTCFNGIYRVNRQGNFNVPIGTKRNVVLDSDDFQKASSLLSEAKILESDFEPLIDEAQDGDLVFLDPPYTVRHNRNGFIKYNEKLFSWEDQERLAKAATRAVERGAIVVATNAAHSTISSLYRSDLFRINTLSRFSGIAATSSSRRQYEELVIMSR